MLADVAISGGAGIVHDIDVINIGNLKGSAGSVLEVVGEAEKTTREGARGSAGLGGTVKRAVEASERDDVVGGLEDIAPFVQQVGSARRSCDAGDVGNQARAVVDHGLERWPRTRRREAVLTNTGTSESTGILISGCRVRVDEKDGHDIIGVFVHPGLDIAEPILERACVEEAARSMAESESVVLLVDLSLQQSQAGAECH